MYVCADIFLTLVGVVVLDTRTKGADSDVYSPLLRINISANSLNILSAILENNIRIV